MSLFIEGGIVSSLHNGPSIFCRLGVEDLFFTEVIMIDMVGVNKTLNPLCYLWTTADVVISRMRTFLSVCSFTLEHDHHFKKAKECIKKKRKKKPKKITTQCVGKFFSMHRW